MLYHYTLGFPFEVELPRTVRVELTKHCRLAMRDDRYGDIELPLKAGTLDLAGFQPIELELRRDGTAAKLVIRGTYAPNPELDLTLVLRKGLVVTCWLNRADDRHATLDTSRYAKPRNARRAA